MPYKKILVTTICINSVLLAAESSTTSKTTPPPAYQPEGVTTQPRGVITPPVAPRVQHGLDVVIDADFTWWKSQVAGMGFADINEKIRAPESNFEPGFKLGLGLDLGFDGWDVYAEYTWVDQPKETNYFKTRSSPGYSTFIRPDSSGNLSVMPLTEAESSRKFQFNIIDAGMGRNFFISKRLTLRPHFGFKACRMFEKTTLSQNGNSLIKEASLSFKQTLSALGIRGGINTVWHMTRTFGFYGDLSISTLWSAFYNKSTSKTTFDSESTSHSSKNKSQTILPVIEAGIGLTYMTWFNNEKYQVYAKAGWEQQAWIDYNHNAISGMPNDTGILSIQGLTVKAGFAF